MRTELLLSGLRALGLALRLSLSLFVVAFMGLEVFGTLSLLLAMTALAAPLATMGLHYRTNRDVVDAPAQVMAERLRDRVALNTLAGAGLTLVLGLATPLMLGVGLTGQGVMLFLILCVLEVVVADAQNLLISCRRTILAALLLFVRSALWVPPMMLTVHVTGWTGLDPVLWFWLGGTVAALAIMAVGLADWPWRDALRGTPALRAQFAGFRLSAGIWLSDVSVAATPVIERSLLLALLGPVAGGGYIFFWTLANGILQIVTASVVIPSVPVLVAAAQGAAADFRQLVLRLSGRTALYAVVAGALLTGATARWLDRLERSELFALLHILPILLAGTALVCVAEVMRLALYAQRRDRALIFTNLAMVGLNTGLVALAAALSGASAVAMVTVLVATGVAALRWRWITQNGA